MNVSYYIKELLRKPDAAQARIYLGLPAVGAYGELYLADNFTPQTLTLQNTFYKWTTGWIEGEMLDCAPSAANANILANTTAPYRVSVSFGADVTGVNQTLEFAIFRNGIYQPDHSMHVTMPLTRGNAGCIVGILTLDAGDVIDFRVQNITSAGKDLTLEDANLSCSAI